ncbi:MAG: PH domain-containing protein [Clostridia bacterium]|nr:PH domain-containing protein [Clostridia bacterium]
MKPNFVATKSKCAVVNFGSILACILIIPIFILIFRIMAISKYKIEFYDDKIITYSGLINKKKRQTAFVGVTSVNVEQSLFGRMFNYGTIEVDCVGMWDIDTTYIKNPSELEIYLQTRIVKAPQTNMYVQM